MGAIFPDEVVECHRCGRDVRIGSQEAEKRGPVECGTCKVLGPKALVPLLRGGTPEQFAAYHAAPKPSVLFRAQMARRGIKEPWEGGPPWDRSRW